MTALQGRRLRLEPLQDIKYFIDLADKDNKGLYTREGIEKTIKEFGAEFWDIWLDGTKRGVAGYFKFGHIYFLEALKDHSQPPTGIGYSVEVGNLILDYMSSFTDKIYTCARRKDLAIQILCKKLGFEQIDEQVITNHKEDLVFFKREGK